MCPVLPQSTPISRYNSASPTIPISLQSQCFTNSKVEVMDVLNRSMTNQYTVLLETLRQSQSASKEHYLSNAKSCNGKNPKEFGMWLDEVSRLATVCDNNLMKVALAISNGTSHKYINDLVSSSMSWLPIKVQFQERFLKCGSATMAKHKLKQLKQSELPMHEYIATFGDMAEHAYNIKPTDSANIILASNLLRVYRTLMLKKN